MMVLSLFARNPPTSQDQKGCCRTREQVSDILLERDFVTVPEDKANLIKNCILKSNPTIIDESYFLFDDTFVDDEIVIEATDAIYTGFRIFGTPVHDIPNLREQQILDFDLEILFADAEKLGVTPDGKHFFDHGSRRLYLHKVDRTPIEECLGVDLIYNLLDQRRLVFVQYKCQRAQGKYYRASDASHDSEIERMAASQPFGGWSDHAPNAAGTDHQPHPASRSVHRREATGDGGSSLTCRTTSILPRMAPATSSSSTTSDILM